MKSIVLLFGAIVLGLILYIAGAYVGLYESMWAIENGHFTANVAIAFLLVLIFASFIILIPFVRRK